MPPRKTTVTPTEPDLNSIEAMSEEVFETNPPQSAAFVPLFTNRPSRTVRDGHHIPASQTGNFRSYRHKDILDGIWDYGFLYSEVMSTAVYPGGGPVSGEPLAVVVVRTFWDNGDGTIYHFDGVGDASPSNCQQRTGQHFTRMAATRAFDRSVGLAMNLDSNSAEEFAGNEDQPVAAKADYRKPITQGNSFKPAAPNPANYPPENSDQDSGYECDECGFEIRGNDSGAPNSKYTAGQLAEMSMKQYGKILCWKHGKGRDQAA